MRTTVIVWSMVSILIGLSSPVSSRELNKGEILISRDSSTDTINYATNRAEVRVQRKDSGEADGIQYLVKYSATGQNEISYRFDATPQVELFEVVGLEVTKEFCNRDIAIVTVREYLNIEEPQYLYTRVFLELAHPGKGFDYLDGAANTMGGPTPLGLLGEYANVDCSTMPIEVTDKSR